MIHPSELILNPDGSIYHLKLKPEQLASKIILAGDPSRINIISSKFDRIDFKVNNREFVTHTGLFNNKRISAISTGIGTDNIDIVLNELDALANINLEDRCVKPELCSLEIVRIGTCGSIQEHVSVDKIILSSHAIGLDGLLNFYQFEANQSENELLDQFLEQTSWPPSLNNPYLVSADKILMAKIGKGFNSGITITANGFYAPQNRSIRIQPQFKDLTKRFQDFNYEGHQIVNYEMETSGLYGLSKLLGHRACTLCAVVANRHSNTFSKNFNPIISNLIDTVLERLTNDRA